MSNHRLVWLLGRLVLACLVFTMLLSGGPKTALAATVSMGLGNDEGFLVFQPEQLTINAGDTVSFEMRGLGPHNLIVAGHPEWSHEPLRFALGESWEQKFDVPGRYAIWCEPHRAAGMTAEINVLAPG